MESIYREHKKEEFMELDLETPEHSQNNYWSKNPTKSFCGIKGD